MSKPEKVFHELELLNGGDSVSVRVGNTVIDIMHGYDHGDDVSTAVVQMYKYDRKIEKRVIIYNDKTIVYSE